MLTAASISCCSPHCAQFKGVKPSGDRVLVKVDKEESKTVGGVLLPTVAQNKPTAGAVVALGEVELVKVSSAWCCRPSSSLSYWISWHWLRQASPIGGVAAAAPIGGGARARCVLSRSGFAPVAPAARTAPPTRACACRGCSLGTAWCTPSTPALSWPSAATSTCCSRCGGGIVRECLGAEPALPARGITPARQIALLARALAA